MKLGQAEKVLLPSWKLGLSTIEQGDVFDLFTWGNCAGPRGNGETQVKQIKDVSLSDGTKAKFSAWKQNSLCLAKLHGLFGIFTEGVDAPVADETMSIAVFLQEAFPHENVQKKYFMAWNILSRAIANNGDRDTLCHAFSPASRWRALVDTYCSLRLVNV